MTHELKGREIFAAGVWNDMEFSEADLEDIVANFDKLIGKHKVPLKFGHNDEQDITDGQPAIGWVERIFKQGDKLFADFTHLPRTVFEAIKNKLYRTVSVELLFNVDADGVKFNHVLDAVALLGADHPAVNSLADLDALLAKRTVFSGGHRVAFDTVSGKAGKRIITQKDDEMDKKEVQELIDATTAPLKEANAQLSKDLKDANVTIAKFTSDKADDEKQRKEEAVKLARKSVTDILDAAVRAKTLTPAIRTVYEKQVGVADDERVVKIDLEEVRSMFDVKVVDDKPTGLHTKPGDDDFDEKDPEAALLSLVYKNQADTGESDFATCFSRVAVANPKLHRAYLDANGEG